MAAASLKASGILCFAAVVLDAVLLATPDLRAQMLDLDALRTFDYGLEGKPIVTDDDWGGSAELKAAFGAVGAFTLEGSSRDAAILITLSPGSYTAEANAADAGSGAALVEVYEVP